MIRCKCPLEGTGAAPISQYSPEEYAGRIHLPGKCAGTYRLRRFQRGKTALVLCSCCHLPSDVLLEGEAVP